MMPHAKLQPRAPISMTRTPSRPASATLNEPVKVRTMIKPKRTSEMRSCGSRTRLDDLNRSNMTEDFVSQDGGRLHTPAGKPFLNQFIADGEQGGTNEQSDETKGD